MAKTDQMSRNIVTKAKNAVTKVPKYATSTAKLFAASGSEFFATTMPAPVSMITTNKELLDDAVRFLRNPVDSINKQVNRALGSDDFKAISKFAKNALEDLKTGNLYDPNRDRSQWGADIDSMLEDFGGLDMGNFDENGDWIEGGDLTNGDKELQIAIAKVQDEHDGNRTSAMIDAISASTKATVNTSNSNAQMALRMAIKQHSQQMAAMENLITAQTSTFELISKSVQAQVDITREAHNRTMDKLEEMTSLLRKISEGVSPEPKRPEYKEQNDIFGNDGELDIKKFIKQSIKNADEKLGISSAISMATMGQSLSQILELAADNPWQLVTDQIINSIVENNPTAKKMHAQMERTNKNISSFMPALLQKFGERGRAFDEGRSNNPLDMLLGIFGFTPRSRIAIDTAYENPLKPVQITSKTTRAIEEVIPMWLARIDSHISGTPLMVYNYKTGRLDRADQTLANFEHSTKDLVGRMDSAREIISRAGMYDFLDERAKEQFKEYTHKYLQKQAEESKFINPWVDEDEFAKDLPYDVNGDFYARLLQGILRSLPRSTLMQTSRDIMSARRSRDRNTFNTNNDLKESGLIAAYSGFLDPNISSSIISKSANKSGGLSTEEIDKISTDLNTQTIAKGGTAAGNVLLADILRTLRRGIITYSYNTGDISSRNAIGATTQMPEYVIEQMRKVQDISDTQFGIDTTNERRAKSRAENEAAYYNQILNNNKAKQADVTRSESDFFVNRDMTLDQLTSIQVTKNYEELKKQDPLSPEVIRRREALDPAVNLLTSTKDDIINKTGISKALTLIGKAAESPFALFTSAMEFTDAFLFKMLYGEDAASRVALDGPPALLQILSDSLKVHFTDAKNWFADNIGDPVKKFLFDKEDGIFHRISESFKELVGWDEKKDKAKGKLKEFREKFTGTRELDAEGKPIGDYKGGIFSSTLNKVNKLKGSTQDEMSSAISRMLYGDYADSKRKGVGETKYVTDKDGNTHIETEYGGVIGKMRKGFDSVGEFFLGDVYSDPDSRNKWNKVKKEFGDALPDTVIGSGMGLLAGLFLPGGPILGGILGASAGLIKGSDGLSKFLFGEFSETEEEDMIGFDGKVITDWKTGKARKRKKQTAKGLISREVYDGFKMYAPKITLGAVLGAAAGGLGILPFGMGTMAGSIIGGMGGMLGANDKVKELIFGKVDDPKSGLISKDFRDKFKDTIKKYAPSSIAGLLGGAGAWGIISNLGLIPGIAALPGGPIFSILGGLVGLSNADKFNKMLFGEEVEEPDPEKPGETKKVRKGGVFGGIYDFTKNKMLTPMAEKFDAMGKKIGEWFHKDILGPIDRTIEPLKKGLTDAGNKIKDSLLSIGDHITTGILKAFNINVGDSLGKYFKEDLLPRLKKNTNSIFNAIGKMIGKILSAPFKALETIVTGSFKRDDEEHMSLFERSRRRRQERRHARHQERMKDNFQEAGVHAGNIFTRFRDIFAPNQIYDEKGNLYGTGLRGLIDRDKSKDIAGISGTAKNEFGAPTGPVKPLYYQDSTGRWRDSNGKYAKASVAKAALGIQDAEDDVRKAKDKAEKPKKEKKTKEVTDSDRKKSGSTEDSDAELNRRRTRVSRNKSDNEYLKEISSHTRAIRNEIKGQLGGVGWNIAYIKTMLDKVHGPLSDEQLPEEMEGSKSVKKRRGFFGRVKDRVGGMLGAGADKVLNFFGLSKDMLKTGLGKLGGGVKMLFQLILSPGKIIGKIASALLDGVNLLLDGLVGTVKLIGDTVGGALKAAGNLIVGAAKGVGESVGNAFGLLTGVIKDVTLTLTATARGMVEFLADTVPGMASFIFKSIGALGKGAWNLGKAGVKKTGQAIKWGWNKLRGKKDATVEEQVRSIGTFKIDGGHLDNVNSSHIEIGDATAPRPFPWTSVVNGIAVHKSNDAIPVYILGVDPKANMGGGRGSGKSPIADQQNDFDKLSDEDRNWYLKMKQLEDDINTTPTLWFGGEGVTLDKNGNVKNVTRHYDPILEQMAINEQARRSREDKVKEKDERAKDKKKKKSDKDYMRFYRKADRALERSSDSNQAFDRVVNDATTREEMEAAMMARQGNYMAGSGGGGSSESGKGKSIWDSLQTIGKILGSGLVALIPSVAAIAYGIGTDGEGHVAQRGVGALAKKLTTSFGIDKLTPQQAKEAFSGTGAAKKYADIMGDFSSDIGKKFFTKSARNKASQNIARAGKVGDIFHKVADPISNFFRTLADPDGVTDTLSGFTKDSAGRWRDASGKFVKKSVIDDAVASTAKNKKGLAYKFATSKAGNTIRNLATKSKSAVQKVLNSFFELSAVKSMMKTLTKYSSKVKNFIADTVLGGAFTKAAANMGSSSIEQAMRTVGGWTTGGIVTAAFAVADFTTGWADAYRIFNVSHSDVTFAMHATAAIVRTLSGLLSVIPGVGNVLSIAAAFAEDTLVQGIYNIFAGEDKQIQLKENQKALEQATKIHNQTTGENLTTDQYAKMYNNDGTKRGNIFKRAWNGIKTGAKNFWDFMTYSDRYFTDYSDEGQGWGTGASGMKRFSQRSAKWNQGNQSIAKVGCGPTVAAMVASAYGKSGNPIEANAASYNMGMRASDGGTNPAFFGRYAAGKGFGMQEGPISYNNISKNLSKGQPVVLMGKGGAFGPNTHYIIANRSMGKGRVSLVDPMTGGTKSARLSDVLSKTTSSIYSFGKGEGGDEPISLDDVRNRSIFEGVSSDNMILDNVGTIFSNLANKYDSVLNWFRNGTVVDSGFTGHSRNDVTTGSTSTSSSTTSSSGSSKVNMSASGGYSKITPTDSARRIWQYLKDKGYTDYAAAGLMGCWQQESSNRSDRVEGDYLKSFPGFATTLASNENLNAWTERLFRAYANSNISINEEAYKGVDGNYYPGIGLAQWTGPRGYNLFKFANDNGKDWRNLDTQLAFFTTEDNARGLKGKLNTATSAADGAHKALDHYEMYVGYGKKAPSALSTRVNHANKIFNTYSGTYVPGLDEEDKIDGKTAAEWGMGTGTTEYDWGTGSASTNLNIVNDKIRKINSSITKMRAEAAQTETAAQVTQAITKAVDKATSSDQSTDQVLKVLTASLSTMIQLLSDIKDNTAKKDDDDSSRKGQNIPTVRADNFGSSVTPNGDNPNDIGAQIINNLTSK